MHSFFPRTHSSGNTVRAQIPIRWLFAPLLARAIKRTFRPRCPLPENRKDDVFQAANAVYSRASLPTPLIVCFDPIVHWFQSSQDGAHTIGSRAYPVLGVTYNFAERTKKTQLMGIFAHEAGHAALGHFWKEGRLPYYPNFGILPRWACNLLHYKFFEFQADRFAYDLGFGKGLLKYLKSELRRDWGEIGREQQFNSLPLTTRFFLIASGKSHPALSSRIARLEKLLEGES